MSESPPLTARAEKVSADAGRGGGGKGPGWGRGCVEDCGRRVWASRRTDRCLHDLSRGGGVFLFFVFLL